MKTVRVKFIVVSVLLLLIFFSCKPRPQIGYERTIPPWVERGRLIAITDFTSTSYFIYRGEPMGYQYELMKLFADHIGVKLEIKVSNNLNESFDALINGDSDLIAKSLTVTKERSQKVDFTNPIMQTRQVLVQRKPADWYLLSEAELERALLRNQLDLAGKTVHVQKSSAYASRLKSLSDEIGDTINIIETNYETEQLIAMVVNGTIDYTVSDENIAMVNQTYYPVIDIKTAVSFSQNLAWAVKNGNKQLLDELNSWLEGFTGTIESNLLYAKYFRNPRSARFVASDYFAITSGRISPYDELIKKYSEKIGWDWRLLASLIYQESRFYPNAESWAGATGLMQLMPSTAERFGVTQILDPEQNIAAGVQFITWLDGVFSEKPIDEAERLKFILASYNVGLGHVLDARELARKNGKNPDIWTGSVDYFILNKSNPEYYLDPVVRHGYARGMEPYMFVTEILDRYKHYQNIVRP